MRPQIPWILEAYIPLWTKMKMGWGLGFRKRKKAIHKEWGEKNKHTVAGKSLLDNLETVGQRGNPANRPPAEYSLRLRSTC